jgi:hypothetical protein
MKKDQGATVVVLTAAVVFVVVTAVVARGAGVAVVFVFVAVVVALPGDPLLIGGAAVPLTVSTDNSTDPCPTVVEPLVRTLPSL